MHGELAQLIALTAHGSVFLSSDDEKAPELYPTSSVFRYTGNLEFHLHTRRFGISRDSSVVARDCASWYEDLRRRGIGGLRLVRSRAVPRNRDLAPHMEAGFSGGLDVAIAGMSNRGQRELWSGRWRVAAPKDPERRIWSMELHGAVTRASVDDGPLSLDAPSRRLASALDAAIALVAGRAHFEWFEERFRTARSQLDSPEPQIAWHPDMFPTNGYGLRGRQLLAAVSNGWVFGGMGSWNDVMIDDGERYRRVTIELFAAVMDGALAATNAGRESGHRG